MFPFVVKLNFENFKRNQTGRAFLITVFFQQTRTCLIKF
jgi:hypothetical protein